MVADPAPSITLPFFIRRTLGFRSRFRIPYDRAVKLRFAESTYLLTHPDDVRHVLVDHAVNYTKTPHLTSAAGKRRAGAGLLTASGEEHQRLRRLLQPLFHRTAMARFSPVVIDRVEALFADWRHRSEVDIARDMAKLAQSIIVGVIFGKNFHDPEDQLARAIHARRRYTEHVYNSRIPFRDHLPLPVVRSHGRALRDLDDTIAREIRIRRPSTNGADDFLSLLVDLSSPDGSRLSDRQIRDEVLTLTSTGYETIAEALTWTWYLLMTHPDVARQLFAEVDGVLGGRAPSVGDVSALEFTEGVLKESMRLYPPTWVFVRVPIAPDSLPSGTVVPAGAKLYLCQWVMHRHPRYFPSPEQFCPARFTSGTRGAFRFVYFPFGDGPHTCIGEAFATLQGVLVLSYVAQRFRFELVPGQKIVPRAGITLTPRHGLRVEVHPRTVADAAPFPLAVDRGL